MVEPATSAIYATSIYTAMGPAIHITRMGAVGYATHARLGTIIAALSRSFLNLRK
jgi:branched-subunit amino acid permease